MLVLIKKLIGFGIEMIYPKTCFFCGSAGVFVCDDCFALMEISPYHRPCPKGRLDDLFCACSYDNRFVKKLIQAFKYEPYLKMLKRPLAKLAIDHFDLLETKPDLRNYALVAVPVSRRRLRRRCFNQSEEISSELARSLNLPRLPGALEKIKENKPQAELNGLERRLNAKGTISCAKPDLVKGRLILLVDDVYTTGATMEECAKILKQNGAAAVVGIAIAGSNG